MEKPRERHEQCPRCQAPLWFSPATGDYACSDRRCAWTTDVARLGETLRAHGLEPERGVKLTTGGMAFPGDRTYAQLAMSLRISGPELAAAALEPAGATWAGHRWLDDAVEGHISLHARRTGKMLARWDALREWCETHPRQLAAMATPRGTFVLEWRPAHLDGITEAPEARRWRALSGLFE